MMKTELLWLPRRGVKLSDRCGEYRECSVWQCCFDKRSIIAAQASHKSSEQARSELRAAAAPLEEATAAKIKERAASLQDNILFGRIVTRYAEAQGRKFVNFEKARKLCYTSITCDRPAKSRNYEWQVYKLDEATSSTQ